ncbi:MAG: alpha-galactosidase [Chthoniobacterales bacterium]
MTTLPDFTLGDLTFHYASKDGAVGLEIYPTALKNSRVPKRGGLAGLPYIDAIPDAGNPPASVIDVLSQVKIVGDSYPGAFSQGHTMRNSPSVDAFRLVGQRTENDGTRTSVITTLQSARQHRMEHRLSWFDGDLAVEVSTTFFNDSDAPVSLEMLSSFCLGGITPFDEADGSGRLRVHRFRSVWSAEGRLETRSLEELHLERSWSGAGMFSERFGQIGTMPVRKWFPFVAIEDTAAGVVWGAQLAWAGSWQMEVFRQHDNVSISGGLADREFGHWLKTLAPGESIATPPATLSCVQGTLDDLCDRLTAVQNRPADSHPAVEADMPIVFNEWCTTWGDPQHDKVVAIADRLQGSQVRFLVIDAGWYKDESTDWSSGHGDWIPSSKLFPSGLEVTAQAIRERGLIPGLWFEMETVGSQSTAFTALSAHMLQRDGIPVTVRERRFWNLNDPVALDFLTGHVIDLLERCGFGYLKVDYNETAGFGAENPDSLGEGLRQQVLGSHRFFEKIRERLPELVIENCASGGHRLEPSMLARTAMSSFSDAHELVEIPIIAANLHSLMLPRQSQIWAVLHRSDSLQRLTYSLTATFLGRMCLSGEITELSDEQYALVLEAERLYGEAAPTIKHGTSRRFGKIGASGRYPEGWQAVRRVSADGRQILVVVHSFAQAPGTMEVPLPAGDWKIAAAFGETRAELGSNQLRLTNAADFSGSVILLKLA